MSDNSDFNYEGCVQVVIALAVAVLVILTLLDLYTDNRDMNHIRDLQRRVGAIESRCTNPPNIQLTRDCGPGLPCGAGSVTVGCREREERARR